MIEIAKHERETRSVMWRRPIALRICREYDRHKTSNVENMIEIAKHERVTRSVMWSVEKTYYQAENMTKHETERYPFYIIDVKWRRPITLRIQRIW